MNNSRISVIIPIYNVKPYLKQCIDSVVAQTYYDIQIILVDDGSTDGSGRICDEYSKRDSRIIVIHKENGGLSDARNVGTKAADGSFIFYLDSDDFIEKNTIELMMTELQTHNSDIVVANYFYTYPKFETVAETVFNKTTLLNTHEAMEALVKGDLQTFAWGKLISSRIAKSCFFPKGKLFEDHFWTHYVFSMARRITVINNPLVHYVQRNSSISNSFDVERLDVIDGWLERLEFLENNYPDLVEVYLERCAFDCVNLGWLVLIKMKNQKTYGLRRLQGICRRLKLRNYAKGKRKRLLISLDKSILNFSFKAIIYRYKGFHYDSKSY